MLSREEIIQVYDQGPDAVVTLVQKLCAMIEQQQIQIEQQQIQIDQQQKQIVQLTNRVKELEDRLALNSRNSSNPPSSDQNKRQLPSTRGKSGKKSGGQTGHPGKTLKRVEQPDHVINHAPESCVACGESLETIAGEAGRERRQVFDVPPIKLEVTEHRVVRKTCLNCGKENCGQFPQEVKPGVSYGHEIKALAVYLVNYQLIPWQRSCELIGDLLHQPIAEGTLMAAIRDCAAGLAEIESKIKDAIAVSKVVNFDETGMYAKSRRQWLHTASTNQLTHYAVHNKRGSAAAKEIGILPNFKGRAIHDSYGSYFLFGCDHGLCNAHHLRELTFVEEEMGQSWAAEMKKLLLDIKNAVTEAKAAGISKLTQRHLKQFRDRYSLLIRRGLALKENQPTSPSGTRGRKKQSKSKNLLDRLAARRKEVLAFMYDFTVPFDNNLAERDLRMMKVQQKISGCFRTHQGAQNFCRIRGYISTLKKQGRHILSAITSIFAGQPLLPALRG